MSLGIFGVLAIGLSDAFFLARAGQSELTAIGFIYPVIVAISAFSVGLSAGANTALSQARGRAEDDRHVASLGLHATLIGLVVGLTFGAAFWLASPRLFALLGAQGAVLDNVLAYTPLWAASFPILVVTMVLNASFRAAGDGLTSAALMVLTALLNIAMTPVLIFGIGPAPELGMAGAGLGTLLARILTGSLALRIAYRRRLIAPGPSPMAGFAESAREMLGVGLPAALSRAINPAGMAAVTAAVATVGDSAVAGFGAAGRVQAISLVPFFALASGLAPVVGQAWGAGDRGRAQQAMRAATFFTLAYGAALAALLVTFATPIAHAMTAKSDAAVFAADYLRFVGWSLAGYGLAVTANAAMTGRSRAGWAMGLSLGRIALIYIPGAWIGVTLAGYPGVLAAAALANVLAFWGALVATRATGVGPVSIGPVDAPAQRLAALVAAGAGRTVPR